MFMKISRFSSSQYPNIGLLLLRLGVGVTFLVHGIGKLNNISGTTMFFESIGLNGFMAWFIALVETIGGAMLILGVWTLVPALLFVVIMLVAIFKVKWGGSFTGQGGYELDFVLLLSSLAIASLGSGKYSLIKSHLCGNCKECACACHPDKACGPDGKCATCKC